MTDAAPDLSLAERIDSICDQFEQDFRGGKQPQIESYLGESQEPLRSKLLRAVVGLEIELRQKQGEKPQPEEYISRFPNHVDAIQQVFTEVRSILSSVKVSTAETSKGPAAVPVVSAVDSPPLRQLGRFQILSVLGEGAFGTVYKAHDPQLDRDVAVKVPRFNSLQNKDDRERFLREGRAAAGLHHPQICPVYEVGTIDGRDYIVMAFIDGKPLNKVLQSQANLSDKQVASVIRKVALGLQEAHDKGVIHRDLKPANIMINRKGEPVIMDFGLARRSNSADAQISQSGQIMGTPAYMSPEQARGDGKLVGPAADIYGLGVMFYELLCGRRPFEGTITEVLGKILHVDAEAPSQHRPGVDSRLETICLKAIAKKPSDRYASMTEFAAALTEYVKTGSTVQPTATAKVDEPAQEGALHTKQFAKLMAAVSSDLEEKVERAASRAVRKSRKPQKVKVPWWTYLVGSGLMGVIVLLGIFFFIRKDTVTVIVNIPIENIHDPSLSFILDNKAVAAEAFAAPIELKPGEHELIVNKDGKEFKRFLFNVGEANNQPVIVQDVTTKPPGPEPAMAPFNAEKALRYQEEWAEHLGLPVEFTNNIGMRFRLIPPGTYRRGMSDAEVQAVVKYDPDYKGEFFAKEMPQHTVQITQPFYLGVTEVTVGQFRSFIDATGRKTTAEKFYANNQGQNDQWKSWKDTPWKQGETHPVVNVAWNDSVAFCQWLSNQEKAEYRLPTEAEWEYGCRAGTTGLWSNDDDIEDLVKMANVADLTAQAKLKHDLPNLKIQYVQASDGAVHPTPVGHYRENPFGLHDMIGNVWEWCSDFQGDATYSEFAKKTAVDPRGPPQGATRVRRGGAWITGVRYARSAVRISDNPDTVWTISYGFRVAIAVKEGMRVTRGRRAAVRELNVTGYDTFPWLSTGGKRMYFESRKPNNEPDNQPWVWMAERSDPQSPFGAKRQLFPARHPTLTGDELEMVFLRGRPGNGSLRYGRRASILEEFILYGEIPELIGEANPKSPFLSEEGLTLVFQRGRDEDKSIELVYCTRNDRNLPWSKPRALPLTPDPTWTEPITWPFLSRDGLTLWYCHGSDKSPEIRKATRPDRNSPFGNHQRVIVEGTRLIGRSPRFVETTGELFYSPNLTENQDDWWLWVVKDYAEPVVTTTANDGFVSLFNGQDLTGWNGNPTLWKVVDGVLVGKMPDGKQDSFSYLVTQQPYRDFELKVVAKLVSGNSGVQIRSTIVDPQTFDMHGPQVEIAPGDGVFWGTTISTPTGKPVVVSQLDQAKPALRLHDFNELVIRCVGKHVTVSLNGTVVNDTDFEMPADGFIGLQLHKGHPGMEVRYKVVAIRKL